MCFSTSSSQANAGLKAVGCVARSVPRAGWQGGGAGVRGGRHVRYELLATIILINASQDSNENIRPKVSKRGNKQLNQNEVSYSSGASPAWMTSSMRCASIK